jgi:hypothetical protein
LSSFYKSFIGRNKNKDVRFPKLKLNKKKKTLRINNIEYEKTPSLRKISHDLTPLDIKSSIKKNSKESKKTRINILSKIRQKLAF